MTPPDAPPRGFSTDEYRARFASVQQAMQQQDISAILLTTEHDINYFTGFHTPFWQSPTRPWFVILPASGTEPVAVIPEIGLGCMRNGWLHDIRTWASPHPDDDGVSLLAGTLAELTGDDVDRIGINQGRETHVHMPLAEFHRLQQLIGLNDGFRDATAIVRDQRMIKSSAEIAKIRYVAQTASSVFQRVFDFVDIGMRDSEVFRRFRIECLEAGVDDVAYLVGAADQGGYDNIISPPAGRPVREGDVLILDTGCVYDSYYCDFDRNYGFGTIPATTLDAHRTLFDATEAGLQAARPGNTCRDLYAAMHSVMADAGAIGESVGRFGHGLGLQLTEPPSHTAWDTTELQAGMVLTLEPGMQFAPGKMLVHEENIVITENEPELLSVRAPRELCVKR